MLSNETDCRIRLGRNAQYEGMSRLVAPQQRIEATRKTSYTVVTSKRIRVSTARPHSSRSRPGLYIDPRPLQRARFENPTVRSPSSSNVGPLYSNSLLLL
ncbi:unnamed protein product [Ectocarpus sp. 6 AP-2014]